MLTSLKACESALLMQPISKANNNSVTGKKSFSIEQLSEGQIQPLSLLPGFLKEAVSTF